MEDIMKIGHTVSTLIAAVALTIPGFAAVGDQANPKLTNEVQQTILKLPYYSVFDGINFEVDAAGVVTLNGQVRTYNVHNSAVSAVKRIPGVVRVNDNIEVLPLSPFDDNIRVRAYNAIFGDPVVSRYAIRSVSPIRILVKNGEVTIAGVVNNELERRVIFARVSSLPGTLTVTNALRIDSEVQAGEVEQPKS
jgi:hyperosmotically inducible protein